MLCLSPSALHVGGWGTSMHLAFLLPVCGVLVFTRSEDLKHNELYKYKLSVSSIIYKCVLYTPLSRWTICLLFTINQSCMAVVRDPVHHLGSLSVDIQWQFWSFAQ